MTTTSIIAAHQLIRVKSVALHRVRVPLVEPFRISNGVVAEKDAILVEVTTAGESLAGRSIADVRLVLLRRHTGACVGSSKPAVSSGTIRSRRD